MRVSLAVSAHVSRDPPNTLDAQPLEGASPWEGSSEQPLASVSPETRAWGPEVDLGASKPCSELEGASPTWAPLADSTCLNTDASFEKKPLLTTSKS